MSIKLAPLTASGASVGMIEDSVAGINERWHDAWGDVQKAIVDTTAALTTTVTGSTPTIVPSVTAGEVFTVTTPATDYSGINSQVTGEKIKLELGKPFKLYGQFKCGEATQSDFLFGACVTKTDLMATSVGHAISVVEGLFFCKIDGVTAINAHVYVGSAQTGIAAVGTMDTSAHEYEIEWDGTRVYFYFDKALKGSFAASLPTNDLTLSWNLRAGSAAANTFTIMHPAPRVIQARS